MWSGRSTRSRPRCAVSHNFLPCDREQELLLPPSLSEWLAEDHLAWFVLDAVSELELGAFYASYRRDGWGAAAHDPGMMVALLVYAYAIGERSSRAIERRCREDVAFRVITANRVPDHATIARFRVRHEAALGDLFGQVLGLCADAGLVSVGVIALDGSKVAAAASDRAIRSYEQIAAEILEEAGRLDAAEDDIHGPCRGDELPDHIAKPEGRRAGCARRSSGSSASARSAPSRFRATVASGFRSASGDWSRSGGRSGSRTGNTRRAGSAACSSAAANRWAPARGHTPRRRDPRGGSTRPTRTPSG
jgi:transposase